MCCIRCCATTGTFRCFRQRCERLHHPPPDADARALADRTDPAWQRLKFDELVAQQIALRQARAARQRHRAPALHADGLAARLLAGAAVQADAGAAARLARNRGRSRPRASDAAAGAGRRRQRQDRGRRARRRARDRIRLAGRADGADRTAGRTAFRPHRASGSRRSACARPGWPAGSAPRPSARAQQLVSSGTAQLAIGTHALIQEAVNFDRLGLAIVDEQHRFGVAQRLALRGSDGRCCRTC